MFLNGIAPAPLRTERQIAGALGPRQQRLVRLAQRGVPRRPHDQPVDLAIDGEIVVELAVPVIALHARLQQAQALQVARGMRWAASSAASRSIPASASNNSSMLSVSNRRSAGCGSVAIRTSPSAANSFMASRNGVRERQAPREFGSASTIQAGNSADDHRAHPRRSALMQACPLKLERLSTITDVRFLLHPCASLTCSLIIPSRLVPKYRRI